MMRRLPLLGLALALALPAQADDTPAVVDIKQPSRIRVFGSNQYNLTISMAGNGEDGKRTQVRVEGKGAGSVTPIGALFSMARKNENVSIGMPASFATRTLNDNTRFGAKPFYHEVALVPGQRITIYANFEGYNRRCVPRDTAGQSRDAIRYVLGPSLSITPEPGVDYEMSFGSDGRSCGITARQLLPDGSSVPLRSERDRQRSPVTHKVEGSHLYTFLFQPGSVYYRLVGEPADLGLHADTGEQADAFESAVREIAARPGTQMCIVLPDYGYQSPLMERLNRVLKEQDKAFPAIFERIDGMRRVQQLDDHVPTTFLGAAEYCQIAGILAFAPGMPDLPKVDAPAGVPAAAN